MSDEDSPTIAAMLWGEASPTGLDAVPEANETPAGHVGADPKAVIEEHGRKIAKCEEAIGEHEAMLGEHSKALAASPAPANPSQPSAAARPSFSSFM